MMSSETTDLFETPLAYPDYLARERLARLVGLDSHQARLRNALSIMVNPARLAEWFRQHHGAATDLLDRVRRRPPLVILAGDVGSGKTELAESIGDAVARQENVPLTLLPLSLATRGQGRVGEMTSLLGQAFARTIEEAIKVTEGSERPRGGVLLLVDEADSLAQSREAEQMHHEDRAGVNAFIRGIDQIAARKLPAAVIMCTNRLAALDPAIRRRAADVLVFGRPDVDQRRDVLRPALQPLGFTSVQIEDLVQATGASNGEAYGFTYSDLTQRLLPRLVLDAFPTDPVSPIRALAIARGMRATPPFEDPAGWTAWSTDG